MIPVKKILAICMSLMLTALLAVPAFAAADEGGSFGAYEHVFIFGVDGAGRFFGETDTPNFDRIFQNGAVDHTARTETITISAQNWGSILGGVSYLRHGLTNDVAGSVERSSDTAYPTIFTYARRAFPDAELAAFANWSAITTGIVENDLNVTKMQISDDEKLTDAICAYLNDGNAPKLFFGHFDSVDHVGHELGSKAPEFFKQIQTVDACLGRIYDTLAENDLLDNSLLIVVSDHGHTIRGGHGGLTMRETNTVVAAAGKTVVAGGKLDRDTRNRDVSAIALYALGIERPDYMSSRVPANLFVDTAGERRIVKNEWADTILSKLAWLVTLCTAWV